MRPSKDKLVIGGLANLLSKKNTPINVTDSAFKMCWIICSKHLLDLHIPDTLAQNYGKSHILPVGKCKNINKTMTSLVAHTKKSYRYQLYKKIANTTGVRIDNDYFLFVLLNMMCTNFLAGLLSVMQKLFLCLSQNHTLYQELIKIKNNAPLIRKKIVNIITEIERFTPTVDVVYAQAAENFTIGGVVIEKGYQIIIPICALHRDERHFKNPHKFDLSRYNDTKTDPRKFILPFLELNGGDSPVLPQENRGCLGKSIVYKTATDLLQIMLERGRMEITHPTKIPFRPNLIVPRNMKGIWRPN